MPLDHFPLLRLQLVFLVEDAPRNFQLADIMDQRAECEVSFGKGVDFEQLTDIHRIAEYAFGVAEGLHILIHKQVQLLLDVAYILAKVKLLLQ